MSSTEHKLEDSETSSTIEQEVQTETHHFSRARHIGRHVLAEATGLSIAAGMTYLGYKIGTDVVGPENDQNKFMYYSGLVLPTAVLGGIGLLGGFYAAVAIAPDEKFPSKTN